ncbi:hypothetical protein C8Q70DRAFT_642935 [Cubamyces menziesii]|nr:hypothetical protein C8Q70DRAFT_642935 [Cubamyces menziesii]
MIIGHVSLTFLLVSTGSDPRSLDDIGFYSDLASLGIFVGLQGCGRRPCHWAPNDSYCFGPRGQVHGDRPVLHVVRWALPLLGPR